MRGEILSTEIRSIRTESGELGFKIQALSAGVFCNIQEVQKNTVLLNILCENIILPVQWDTTSILMWCSVF